jgi:murein DD-endopeptidase MepM/ murein hydrolase activator NlpD
MLRALAAIAVSGQRNFDSGSGKSIKFPQTIRFVPPVFRLILTRRESIRHCPTGVVTARNIKKPGCHFVKIGMSLAGVASRVSAMFVDREFFMRSNGDVKFLRVSAHFQRRMAIIVTSLLGLWLIVTLGMAANQVSISIERMMLSSKEQRVATAQERVAAYRESIDKVAEDLESRQDLLDSLTKTHFDSLPAQERTVTDPQAEATAKKVSAAFPEAARLVSLESRQLGYVRALTIMAQRRAEAARQEIRHFGLNPDVLARQEKVGTGGPFIPFGGRNRDELSDPRFARLVDSLEEMDRLETSLAAIPSSLPARIPNLSSGFGYRRDPFTGAGAMHAGLDFKGAQGSPILAAAEGTVSFAGVRGGYGNCVEITHAGGIMTRYAHLSRIGVTAGQTVDRGVMIGQMGSTGRSTGTHLHFEVRLNGAALNPAKFLETRSDVRKTERAG